MTDNTRHGRNPTSGQDLITHAVQGVFWTGGGQVIRQVTGILATIILARTLLPEDFGLLGMAMVFVGFSQLFSDFGIGSAIVQKSEVNQLELASSFWANTLVGLVIALLLVACAPLIAEFYGNERISPVLMVLAFSLLLSALTTVPRAILYRTMEFPAVAKAQVGGSLCGAATAILMALNGYGVWSLVAQPIVGNLVNLIISWRLSRWLPSMTYAWHSIRDLVHFSGGVLGSSIITYATRNLDDLLIGKFLGSTPLGYYSFAYKLMLFPISQVSSVIVKVMFPTLSNLKDDLPRFRHVYLKSIGAISFITFPMMFGLFAVAEEFVLLVLGDKWLPMLPVLKILCFVGMFQSVGTTVGTLYLATAKTGLLFRVSMWSGLVIILSFFAGLPWGIVGVTGSYAVANMLLFYFSHVIAYRQVGLRIVELHAVLVRTLTSALIMFAAIKLFQSLASAWMPDLNTTMHLGLAITVGCLAYVVAVFIVNREQVNELHGTVRSAIGSRLGT